MSEEKAVYEDGVSNEGAFEPIVYTFRKPVKYNGAEYKDITFPRKPIAKDYYDMCPEHQSGNDMPKIIRNITGMPLGMVHKIPMREMRDIYPIVNQYIEYQPTAEEIDILREEIEMPYTIDLTVPLYRPNTKKYIRSITLTREPTCGDFKEYNLTKMTFEHILEAGSKISDLPPGLIGDIDSNDMMKVYTTIKLFL